MSCLWLVLYSTTFLDGNGKMTVPHNCSFRLDAVSPKKSLATDCTVIVLDSNVIPGAPVSSTACPLLG